MDAFEALRGAAEPGVPIVLLDGGASRVFASPVASLAVYEDGAWWREAEGAWARVEGDAWSLLRRLRERAPWTAGIASYDAGRLIERIPSMARDDTGLPLLLFHAFAARWMDGAWEGPVPQPQRQPQPSLGIGPVEPDLPQKQFEDMVARAKRFVREGDVFQVNLSHRLSCAFEGDPLALYARLRAANPAPFSGYLASGPLPRGSPFHVLSSSPERLFECRVGRLEARPIAGTRRRDDDPARDAALKAELRADEKENAEHVMLVDLARNDLGRVARFGSVRVPRLLDVETYRTVHHLVSTVEADLAPGKDAVDAFVAMFPGGTITGAPKVRAMEVIEELEPVRRGVYTGSMGWLARDGDCDLNILIRTLLVRDGRVQLQVGAGIVEDSVPEREYHETLAKAKGMLLALGAGG